MNTNKIERFIYGKWRPWDKEGPGLVLEAHSNAENNDTGTSWWYSAVMPEPFDQASLMYGQMIEMMANDLHEQFLQEVEAVDEKVDIRFLYVNYMRSLETILRDVALFQVKKEGRLSAFVLQTMERKLVSVAVDAVLRYGFSAPEYDYDVETFYLTAMDRPLPEPSPYYFTSEWFQHELSCLLRRNAKEEVSEKKITELVFSLAERMQSVEEGTAEWQNLLDLCRHLENGLLLLKMEASFLDKNPDAIAQADVCAEWVGGLQDDIMGCSGEALVDEMQKLDEVFRWLLNILQPLEEFADGVPLSHACMWMQQLERVWSVERVEAEDGSAVMHNSESSDSGERGPFAVFFSNHFVHKSEVEQALGVSGRTVETYFEEADMEVRRLKLKANVWFLREDLERFLEKRTGD